MNDNSIEMNDSMIQLCLHYINLILKKNGKSLNDFPEMPQYEINDEFRLQLFNNNLINEELSYNTFQLICEVENNLPKLNNEQKIAFDKINKSIDDLKQGQLFDN